MISFKIKYILTNDLDNWDKLRLRLIYNLFHLTILISKFYIFFYPNIIST